MDLIRCFGVAGHPPQQVAGKWTGEDSPDGLARLGEVPLQHGLQERPGELHQVRIRKGNVCFH